MKKYYLLSVVCVLALFAGGVFGQVKSVQTNNLKRKSDASKFDNAVGEIYGET